MLGSTLSNDPLPDKRSDFPFVNPPYGCQWSKDYDAATTRCASREPNAQFSESAKPQAQIKRNLEGLGYGI